MIRLHLPSALAATRDLILSAPDICRALIERIAARMELAELPDSELLTDQQYRTALVEDAANEGMARGVSEREFLSWLLMPCPAGHELGKWGPS